MISALNDSKKDHFPSALHPYFTELGAYPSDWPTFVVNYMDRFIYKHCYHEGKIVSLPVFDDRLMDEIKRWQVQMLTQCGANLKRVFPYVLPDPMMDYYVFI